MNAYEHQDWKQVYLNKANKPNNTNKSRLSQNNSNSEFSIENRLESGKKVLQCIDKAKSDMFKRIRISKRLTQQQISNELNMNVSDVKSVENGEYLKSGTSYQKVMAYIDKNRIK